MFYDRHTRIKLSELRARLMNVWPLSSQTISLRTKNIKLPLEWGVLFGVSTPRLRSTSLPKTLMMPVERVEGLSVFLVLMMLFSSHILQVRPWRRSTAYSLHLLGKMCFKCLLSKLSRQTNYPAHHLLFLFLSERVGCGGLKKPH